MIVVDSSAWIVHLRGQHAPEVRKLRPTAISTRWSRISAFASREQARWSKTEPASVNVGTALRAFAHPTLATARRQDETRELLY